MGNPVAEGRRALVRNMWNERIKGTKRNVEVISNFWQWVRIILDVYSWSFTFSIWAVLMWAFIILKFMASYRSSSSVICNIFLFLQFWQALLAVRALVLPPTEDIETWIKFASLCRKNGRISQARSTLVKLLQVSNLSLWVVDGSVLYFVAYLSCYCSICALTFYDSFLSCSSIQNQLLQLCGIMVPLRWC